MRFGRKMTMALSTIALSSTMLATAAAAAAPEFKSFIINNGTATTTDLREFPTSTLGYSYGLTPYGVVYTSFNSLLGQGKMIDMYKILLNNSYDYYKTSILAYQYGQLPAGGTLETAVANTTKSKALTKVAIEYATNPGVIIYEGPQVPATSSLVLTRSSSDENAWDASQSASYASNPVGQISFLFGGDPSKTINDVTVTVNNADTDANSILVAGIKALLFSEFVNNGTQSANNALGGNIAATYSQVKSILQNLNGGVAVTSLQITAKYAVGTLTKTMTINLN